MGKTLPVLILTGPPGAGKTTTARAVARRADRAVHLESDRFFDFIHAGYVEPWKQESGEQNELVMSIVASAASRYAAAGYFTIIDGIVLPDWFLAPLSDSLAAAGHVVAYAVLRTPLAVCLSRVNARVAESPVNPAVVERLWRDFADLGALERHAIEVDGETPAVAADLVATRLRDGSLVT